MVIIDVKERDKAVIISMAGELALSSIEEFENEFKKHVNDKIDIIALDLKQVQYLNSFGISRIIKVSRLFTDSGTQFILIDMNENIHQIFRMSNFDRVFNIMTRDEFEDKYFPEDKLNKNKNTLNSGNQAAANIGEVEVTEDNGTILVFPDDN